MVVKYPNLGDGDVFVYKNLLNNGNDGSAYLNNCIYKGDMYNIHNTLYNLGDLCYSYGDIYYQKRPFSIKIVGLYIKITNTNISEYYFCSDYKGDLYLIEKDSLWLRQEV